MDAVASSQHSKISIDVQDVWVEIFKRLPVKSIFRFRCVCKSWNSLLSSTFFITYHHNFTISNTPTNQKSYFLVGQSAMLTIKGHAVYHPSQCHAGEHITYVGFPYPFQNTEDFWKFKGSFYSIIGVIHGIVCLATTHHNKKAVVWNPATRRSIPIEFFKGEFEGADHDIGFGFSAAKKDFKLLLLSGTRPYYDIFSVHDGLWRRQTLPGHICGDYVPISNSFFLNGTIYWMACRKCEYVDSGFLCSMLLFDCEREQFKIMELPWELGEFLALLVRHLFVFNDKLSMLRLAKPLGIYEVWVMEEGYGGENTWRKLFTMDEVFHPLSLTDTDVMLGQDGKIVLLSRDDLSKAELPYDCGWWHQPLIGHVFRESLYLTDVKSNASSSTPKQPEPKDEKVYYGCRSKVSFCFNFCLAVTLKLMMMVVEY